MKKTCSISGKEFELRKEDLDFYERMGVPTPTLCPEERTRRRYSWINLRNLYQQKCMATKKNIISIFPECSEMNVYDLEFWWSDSWDGRTFGRDFDFSRPFFEQFNELLHSAPVPAVSRNFARDENSEFTHAAGNNKNCYLIFDSDFNRDCYLSFSINTCENCVDCFRVEKSQLCYECIDSISCYDSKFLQNCTNCSNSIFLKNCIGCKNCFGSINLRNKEYYFLNEKYTKENYFEKVKNLELKKSSGLTGMRENFIEFSEKFPQKFIHGVNNENVLGVYLTNCKNAQFCFDSRKQWDCKYIQQGWEEAKNCFDCTDVGMAAELLYECTNIGDKVYNNRFCTHCFPTISDSDYCYFTIFAKNLFGCVGLKREEFCILNKQYSKEDYFKLRKKIIEHMTKTGEWGEFFPTEISPFRYNQTFANEYFPMSKEEILERGYKWADEDKRDYQSQTYQIPEAITDVPDNICSEILTCENCGKNYKIQKAELAFYRKQNLPIPRKCPDCRHAERIGLRNPRKLWERTCDKCSVEIQTTFAPDRTEKVYCEKCYLEAVN